METSISFSWRWSGSDGCWCDEGLRHEGRHRQEGLGKGECGKSSGKGFAKGEYGKSNEYIMSYEKGKDKGKRAKTKDKQGEETSTHLEFRKSLQVVWQVGTQSERVLARLCSRNGGSSEFFLEFDSAERSGHYDGGCEDGSCHSRGRDGSLVWSAEQAQQRRQTEVKFGTSWFWSVDRCQRLVRTHGVRTYA